MRAGILAALASVASVQRGRAWRKNPMVGLRARASKCLSVVPGQDPHDTCAPSAGACGFDGACDGAGACRTTLVCPAATEQCRGVGVCEPATGTCSYAPAADGVACSDGDACTQQDRCEDGLCKGTPLSCDSPPACRLATSCDAGFCLYTQTAPDGSSDSNCAAATPYCYSGRCAECMTDADCGGARPSCHPETHACACQLPSAGNLLKNPGFDEWVASWPRDWGRPGGSNGVEPDTDAAGCAGSSSVRWTSSGIGQCVPAIQVEEHAVGGLWLPRAGWRKAGTSRRLPARRASGSTSAVGRIE